MLLTLSTRLEDLVVDLLAKDPGLTAAELLERTYVDGYEFTQRAVYKELRKLLQRGVVVKIGSTYRLNIAWVISLVQYTDLVYDRYLDTGNLSNFIIDKEDLQLWTFFNLKNADLFASQMGLALHAMFPRLPMFVWHPHQWTYTIHVDKLGQWKNAIRSSEYKRYVIIGADTYLDRRFSKEAPSMHISSFAPGPFEKIENIHFGIIENYIFRFKMKQSTAKAVDDYYHSVDSSKSFNPIELYTLFNERHRVVLEVERNEVKAAKLRKKFCSYFGLNSADVRSAE